MPRTSRPAQPKPAPDPETLPYALTFFLSRAERASVLARLKRHGSDRSGALMRALRIDAKGPRGGRAT